MNNVACLHTPLTKSGRKLEKVRQINKFSTRVTKLCFSTQMNISSFDKYKVGTQSVYRQKEGKDIKIPL